MRLQYQKECADLRKANAEILALNIVRLPTQKVFDQPVDTAKNGVDLSIRFEDDTSFTVVRFRAEEISYKQTLDPTFFDDEKLEKVKSRARVDFDRGVLGSVDASAFRTDDWVKGYLHVMRRDIAKLTHPEQ